MTGSSRALAFITDQDIFRRYADDIAHAAGLEGLQITPYEDGGVPLFMALGPLERAGVLARLERVWLAVEAVRNDGERASSARLIWAYLKNVRHTAPSDLIARLHDDDTVDFYGLDHQLVFANLTFFRSTSYSLEQLYCLPWPSLYARDRDDVQPILTELCTMVSSPDCDGILDASHVPSHVGWECISRERRRALVEPRFCAPIFDRGTNAGYLWVNRHTMIQD